MPAEPPVRSLLGEPPDDLKAFPRYRLRRGAVIHRNHPAARGPWWFNDGGEGRFDLSGGRGTCYLAQKPVGGLLEAFKGHRAITEEVLARRAEFSVRLRRELALANCCVVRAAQFGMNAEIHSTSDYGKTQRWAAALAAAGCDGIRYFLRSDPSLKLIGYALFGDAGEARAGAWPPGSTSAVSARTVREAARYGLKILPTP